MANFWRFETKKTICQPLKIFQNFPSKFQKNFFFQNCQFWLLTADFLNLSMKLKIMNTHRIGQKSLEPYRSSKSSQNQSKSANMGQTVYVMEKVNFDFWQLIFGICLWNQKWRMLTEWTRCHCSLIGPLKVVINSQKVPIRVKQVMQWKK